MGSALFWKKPRPWERADAFLRKHGLKNREFTMDELTAAAKQAAQEMNLALLCKPCPGAGNLRGLVAQDGDIVMIRYPVGDIVTLMHELAHVLLGHRLHSREEALETCIYTDKEDEEAEEFAHHVLAHSGLVYMRNEANPNCTPEMSEYLRSLDPWEER